MAVKTYKKGQAIQLSSNFVSTEFDCHGDGCCSETLIDDRLVDYLQKIRNHFNRGLNISSGYRCKIHNKNIGGATKSYHSRGQAADIYIVGITPKQIAQYAESIGILGIGLYETDNDGYFVHIDTRTYKYFWYGQGGEERKTFQEGSVKPHTPTPVIKDNSQTIWNFFKKKGLTDAGIAGLMGNLYAESGLSPINLQDNYENSIGMNDIEYTNAVDNKTYTNFVDDDAGYGIAQWTYWGFKKQLLDFHRKANKSIGDLNTQLEFLAYSLSTEFANSVWKVLKSTNNLLTASNAVLTNFERPADQGVSVQNQRKAYGEKYLLKYGVKTPTPSTKPISKPKEGVKGQMKYNKNNKPIECMMTNSTCYQQTRTMDVKGILWHSTGANNPWISRYVQPDDDDPNRDDILNIVGKNNNGNDWNHISMDAGLNCWVGKFDDGTVGTIQTMPWNYRPWGCGSGPKGSCNNGWIQFEICEDGLDNKDYADKVYEEACEITAYLCDMFNVDPYGTVNYNGLSVPTILCHADSCSYGLGSNHADVLHWLPKFGYNMETAREDISKLLNKPGVNPVIPTPPTGKEMYRIRKDWNDTSSQIGAYSNLNNAKKVCDQAGKEYKVYNSAGQSIYPQNAPNPSGPVHFKLNDEVKLLPNATYSDGSDIPDWLMETKLYIRGKRSDGYIVSTVTTGDITGVVSEKYLIPYNGNNITVATPYLAEIIAPLVNVRTSPNINSNIATKVQKGEVYTIVEEKDGWGKLKSGAGWISLQYTRKV